MNLAPHSVVSPSNAVWWFACLLWLGALWTAAPAGGPQKGQPECLNPVALEGGPPGPLRISCSQSGQPSSLPGAAALLFGQPLDLNAAGVVDLTSLPGIGPARAAGIVRTRCESPFLSVKDVLRVPGIGPKTLEGLVGWVRVGIAQPCAGPGELPAPLSRSRGPIAQVTS